MLAPLLLAVVVSSPAPAENLDSERWGVCPLYLAPLTQPGETVTTVVYRVQVAYDSFYPTEPEAKERAAQIAKEGFSVYSVAAPGDQLWYPAHAVLRVRIDYARPGEPLCLGPVPQDRPVRR